MANTKTNLVGRKFGRLLVLEKAPSIVGGGAVKRFHGTWKCQCDCGTIVNVKTVYLTKNGKRSCGCIRNLHGTVYKPGDKVNRLTMVSFSKGRWNCQCECGSFVKIPTHAIKSGNSKSCGCYNLEKIKDPARTKNISASLVKYEPSLFSGKRIWERYVKCDGKENCISFDDFLVIVKENCFWCGIEPNRKYNYFITQKRNSQETKDSGWFTYNGLDRINSDGYHTLDNVVASCYTCNRSKSDLTSEEFLKYVDTLQIKETFDIVSNLIQLPERYMITQVKVIYGAYKYGYGKMEIDLQTFYTYSQLPCFYCGREKSNYTNVYLNDKKCSQIAKDNSHFYYNGIDRVDPTKGHEIDNIVPCCYHCNFAKSKLTLGEFNEWIAQIQKFQATKKSLIAS